MAPAPCQRRAGQQEAGLVPGCCWLAGMARGNLVVGVAVLLCSLPAAGLLGCWLHAREDARAGGPAGWRAGVARQGSSFFPSRPARGGKLSWAWAGGQAAAGRRRVCAGLAKDNTTHESEGAARLVFLSAQLSAPGLSSSIAQWLPMASQRAVVSPGVAGSSASGRCGRISGNGDGCETMRLAVPPWQWLSIVPVKEASRVRQAEWRRRAV